ncbi:MAG: hypothetical protein RL033_137 [Pseudomonadota bacterium]|jgi:uncharacterized membrane protein (DUF2068 family)
MQYSTQTAGLRAIVAYKSIKSALQLTAALLLVALWPLGLPAWLTHAARLLREHATQGWAAELAGLLVLGAAPRSLLWGAVGLALDGSLTALEAWALRTGRPWGAWLVVGATSALLPFEIYEIWRVPRLSRFALFTLNLLISAYLARGAWRERRRHVR